MRVLLLLLSYWLSAQPADEPMSMCELAANYGRYHGKVITVRGVFYHGLRATCDRKCRNARFASFIMASSPTDRVDWSQLAKAQARAEAEAKQGKRFEIWVT